jgi:hypothetical protein
VTTCTLSTTQITRNTCDYKKKFGEGSANSDGKSKLCSHLLASW